jgi:hypothetical protein
VIIITGIKTITTYERREVAAMKNLPHLLYHVGVIIMSAAIALSLPLLVSVLAGKFLAFWAFVENEKIFLVSIEITVAVLLVLFFNHMTKYWRKRDLSRMAKSAGLALVANSRGFFARKKIKELKERSGFGRDIMLLGSTGYRTFVDTDGDLHRVLQKCRGAKIMLLDPLREGAIARAKSIPDPDISPEIFREQIIRSIDFLKGLKGAQKNIRLKLYQDMPLLKLAILGDTLCVRHYHTGLHADDMPEYVFRHDSDPGGLYNPFYQYFFNRWSDPDIPEYDLDTDELVYRDRTGNEVLREKFNEVIMATGDGSVEPETFGREFDLALAAGREKVYA